MKKLSLVIPVLLLAACGGSSPTAPAPVTTPTPLPSRGSYTLAITPDPVLAVPTGNSEFPWQASWRVTISDRVGVVGNVNRVVTTAKNNFGFTFVVSDFNPENFARGIGSNHIPANGNITYTDRMNYRADGNGGQQLTLTIAAEVIDQFLNRVTVSSDVRITAAGIIRLD